MDVQNASGPLDQGLHKVSVQVGPFQSRKRCSQHIGGHHFFGEQLKPKRQLRIDDFLGRISGAIGYQARSVRFSEFCS